MQPPPSPERERVEKYHMKERINTVMMLGIKLDVG